MFTLLTNCTKSVHKTSLVRDLSLKPEAGEIENGAMSRPNDALSQCLALGASA